MAALVVSAIAKWNGSALKKGQKDLTKFQKATNLLAKSFAAAFAVRKITQFGKAAVMAFAADEKAAKSLSIALQNTGNGFATIATEGFISRLQDTFKVLDDELRPAFTTLINATGSLSKAQTGLELALNVSKGTGKDLGAVTMALAKAYGGQTTALSRLGAGLDKATLASGDMDKIMAALTAKFSGQALAATKTYAGQMDALTVASENAKEIIGKGLLDSIALLGGADGIEQATKDMESFAIATSDVTLGLAKVLKKLGPIGDFLNPLSDTNPLSGLRILQNLGQSSRSDTAGKGVPFSGTAYLFTPEAAERAKLIATLKKSNIVEKEKGKLAAAELAAKKKASELDKLKEQFDIERINLTRALENAKTDAERARIRALLTIMDEDANAARARLAELDSTNKATMLANLMAASEVKKLADAAAAAADRLGSIGGVPIGQFAARAVDPATGIANPVLAQAVFVEAEQALAEAVKALEAAQARDAFAQSILDKTAMSGVDQFNEGLSGGLYGSTPVYNVTINTPLGSEQVLTEAMQRALQKLNRYGDSTTFAGAL
jgi:hypothetical protein